jgi:ankyrin repeat protein
MNVSALAALVELNLMSAFINTVDKFNMTPMHIAAINFDYEIFNLLKSLDADMTIKDSEGKTPIDYLKENEDISEDIINEIINQY